IGVKMNAGAGTQKTNIVGQLGIILPPADQPAHLRIERLNADLKLQCAGRKPGDQLAQRVRNPVRNHFKMDEQSRPAAIVKELKNCLADVEVQVEGAVNKLELLHPAVEQPLESIQERGKGELPHRNVQRRETEFAAKRTASRRFHVDYPVGHVFVRVKGVRQSDVV